MRSTTLLTILSILLIGSPAFAQKADGKKSDTKKVEEPAKDEKKPDEKPQGEKKPDEKKPDDPNAKKAAPAADDWNIYDVEEDPGRSYFFVGLRYRGNIVPSFMLNLFVDEGKTVYTNSIGVEFDLRKDGFSLIPALSYQELSTGDVLFKQKGKPDLPQNYGVVNSGIKVMYATVDLLWSTKISKNVEFEYGAGFGLGAVFGELENSWVKLDPNGNLSGSNGKQYVRCEAVLQPGTGCNKLDHQNSEVDKVAGYKEKTWFSGGSLPVVFPWIAVPQFGLRIKPIKNFVGRIGLGFALTGFWFGLNGEYGLEKKRKD